MADRRRCVFRFLELKQSSFKQDPFHWNIQVTDASGARATVRHQEVSVVWGVRPRIQVLAKRAHITGHPFKIDTYEAFKNISKAKSKLRAFSQGLNQGFTPRFLVVTNK